MTDFYRSFEVCSMKEIRLSTRRDNPPPHPVVFALDFWGLEGRTDTNCGLIL